MTSEGVVLLSASVEPTRARFLVENPDELEVAVGTVLPNVLFLAGDRTVRLLGEPRVAENGSVIWLRYWPTGVGDALAVSAHTLLPATVMTGDLELAARISNLPLEGSLPSYRRTWTPTTANRCASRAVSSGMTTQVGRIQRI